MGPGRGFHPLPTYLGSSSRAQAKSARAGFGAWLLCRRLCVLGQAHRGL